MSNNDDLMSSPVPSLHNQGDHVSIGRQQEMKVAAESQQQFHILLKEYMGKLLFSHGFR